MALLFNNILLLLVCISYLTAVVSLETTPGVYHSPSSFKDFLLRDIEPGEDHEISARRSLYSHPDSECGMRGNNYCYAKSSGIDPHGFHKGYINCESPNTVNDRCRYDYVTYQPGHANYVPYNLPFCDIGKCCANPQAITTATMAYSSGGLSVTKSS